MLLSSFLQSNFPPCRRILHFPALTSETRSDGRRRETGAGAEWPGPVSRAGTRGRPGPGHQSGRADQRENIVTRRRKYRGEKYQDVRQQWCGDHRQIVSDEWWHYCHETLNFAESTGAHCDRLKIYIFTKNIFEYEYSDLYYLVSQLPTGNFQNWSRDCFAKGWHQSRYNYKGIFHVCCIWLECLFLSPSKCVFNYNSYPN